MIFVDNDKWPPSQHGTGTEEYFNDAWGFHDYSYAPGSDPEKREQNVNATSGVLIPGFGVQQYWGPNAVFVFNIADSIAFRERILVTLEHGSENEMTNDYSSTVYWYALDGNEDFFVMRPPEERIVPTPDQWTELREVELQKFAVWVKRSVAEVAAAIPNKPTDTMNWRARVRLMRRVTRNWELLGLSPDELEQIQLRVTEYRAQPLEERLPLIDSTFLECVKLLGE